MCLIFSIFNYFKFDISQDNKFATENLHIQILREIKIISSSNKTGVWSDLMVWNCGSIATNRLPNVTDTVKINTGHIVTLDINASIKILNLIGRLNMNAGRILSY